MSSVLSRVSDLVLFFVAVLVVVTNSLLISLIVRSRALRTATNAFIVSMAASDLVLAPGLLLFISLRFFQQDDFVRVAYVLSVLVLGLSPVMTLVSFFFVSLDRYVAICHPTAYTRKVTARRAKVVLCVFWVVNGVFMCMCVTYFSAQQPIELLRERISPKKFIPRRLYYWSYAAQTSLLLLMTILLNIRLFVAMKTGSRKVSVICSGTEARLAKSGESLRILKMIVTSLCVTIVTEVPAFVIGYFPPSNATLVLGTVAFWALAANSFLTPLIHIFMNKSYRNEFYKLFGCARHDVRDTTTALETTAAAAAAPRRRRDAIAPQSVSIAHM